MFLAVLKMTQTETFEFFDRVYPHYTARPGRKNGSEYIFLFVNFVLLGGYANSSMLCSRLMAKFGNRVFKLKIKST